MITSLNDTEVTIKRQVAHNVWKVTAKNQDYAIKAEKKVFEHKADDPAQSFITRWNDMAWAIRVFVDAMLGSPISVWGRELTSGESLRLYGSLPGAAVWSDEEWSKTPLQIADWISDQSDFYAARGNATVNAELTKILDRKEALRELGKGLAVDLFLGNNDRFAFDSMDNNGKARYYVNFDNFFFTTVGKKEVFYMDFWDPNSLDNHRANFGPSDNYLGHLLQKDKGRKQVAAIFADAVQSRLNITISDPIQIAKGLENGKDAIARACGSSGTSAIQKRLRYCGI